MKDFTIHVKDSDLSQLGIITSLLTFDTSLISDIEKITVIFNTPPVSAQGSANLKNFFINYGQVCSEVAGKSGAEGYEHIPLHVKYLNTVSPVTALSMLYADEVSVAENYQPIGFVDTLLSEATFDSGNFISMAEFFWTSMVSYIGSEIETDTLLIFIDRLELIGRDRFDYLDKPWLYISELLDYFTETLAVSIKFVTPSSIISDADIPLDIDLPHTNSASDFYITGLKNLIDFNSKIVRNL